ncbi:MAG: NUDIX hydrolase [Phycisphaeraceae bacterium]
MPSEPDNSQRVYTGTRFNLHRVELPSSDGRTHPREYIAHPGSVLIVPMLDQDHVVLIQNYRFTAKAALWELPAGTLEPPGEEPMRCAVREVEEETGYRAGRMTPLFSFHVCPGISDEVMHAFVAEDLTQVGQELDASERITPHVTEWKRAIQMIRSGEIRDGKTIAGLLYYDRWIRNEGG